MVLRMVPLFYVSSYAVLPRATGWPTETYAASAIGIRAVHDASVLRLQHVA
jgi:hypothetical protein